MAKTAIMCHLLSFGIVILALLHWVFPCKTPSIATVVTAAVPKKWPPIVNGVLSRALILKENTAGVFRGNSSSVNGPYCAQAV